MGAQLLYLIKGGPPAHRLHSTGPAPAAPGRRRSGGPQDKPPTGDA